VFRGKCNIPAQIGRNTAETRAITLEIGP